MQKSNHPIPSSPKKRKKSSNSRRKNNKYYSKKKRRKALRLKIIILGLAFLFALVFIFQAIGNSSPKGLKVIPSPSPSHFPSSTIIKTPAKKVTKTIPTASPLVNSKTTSNTTSNLLDIYTQVDSMAMMGAFSLARQTPSASSKDYSTFLNKLKIAKDNPGNSPLDLAILGNKLVDYVISKNGFNAPVCYAIEAPAVENQSPRQGVWVIYFQPALPPSRQTLVLVKFGVTNCAQATQAVSQVKTDAQRLILSNSSHSVITAAIGKVPSSFLTPFGKALLDESRGFAPKIKK